MVAEELREHATRALLKAEQCFGHVELRVPRETALAMIAGVIGDAISEVEKERDYWARLAAEAEGKSIERMQEIWRLRGNDV